MKNPEDIIKQTKQFRQDLDEVLTRLKAASDRKNDGPNVVRSSRERSVSITKLQEAIMWLGMDLKAMKEEGMEGCENPYPESYNPDNAKIEPTADNLNL